ncbi:MAG: hypothetical protein MMC23_002014 [Stictis urceolatum]|nr:hypothetical protein [Stictis urceolata]
MKGLMQSSDPTSGQNTSEINDLWEDSSDNDNVIHLQSSTTSKSTRKSSSSAKPFASSRPKVLRERKPYAIYSQQYRPMDQVMRPNCKSTLNQKLGITGSNGLAFQHAVGGPHEGARQKKAPRSKRLLFSSTDEFNLLSRPLPHSWRDVSLFDLQLHSLQQGYSDESPDVLPLNWFYVASELIEQGFFTDNELEKWGGISSLKSRYESLRKFFEARGGNGSIHSCSWPNYVDRLLKGESRLSYEDSSHTEGRAVSTPHEGRSDGLRDRSTPYDTTLTRRFALQDAARLGLSTQVGSLTDREVLWVNGHTEASHTLQETAQAFSASPAGDQNIETGGARTPLAPNTFHRSASLSASETRSSNDQIGTRRKNPVEVPSGSAEEEDSDNDSLVG